MSFASFITGVAAGLFLLLLRSGKTSDEALESLRSTLGLGGAGGGMAGQCVNICDSCGASTSPLLPAIAATKPFSAPRCALIGASFRERSTLPSCGTQFFGR